MRTRIFDRDNGNCCLCGIEIDTPKQKWILEHIKPLWLGGADDESNMAPAHYDCAIEKTRKEAPVKAKSDRIRASHLGIKKRRRTIPGRRFNGEPIPARWVE